MFRKHGLNIGQEYHPHRFDITRATRKDNGGLPCTFRPFTPDGVGNGEKRPPIVCGPVVQYLRRIGVCIPKCQHIIGGPPGSLAPEARLFSETASRVVATCVPERSDELRALAREHDVPCAEIGRTGGVRIRIEPGVDITLAEAHDIWSRTLPEALS